MLTVLTYLWSDDNQHWLCRYSPDDVRRLRSAVRDNLTVPHEFIVATDQPQAFASDNGIRAVLLNKTKHIPGTCFAKLMTFHPAGKVLFGEQVFQIDLDTFVIGNLDAIVSRSEALVLWRNPTRVPWDNPTRTGRCYYNTSFVLHRCGTLPKIWNDFNPMMARYRDDQWWISDAVGPDAPYWDGSDGIYRLARADTPGSGVWGKALPDNARLVTFPGSEGKPDDGYVRAENPWIERYQSERFAKASLQPS